MKKPIVIFLILFFTPLTLFAQEYFPFDTAIFDRSLLSGIRKITVYDSTSLGEQDTIFYLFNKKGKITKKVGLINGKLETVDSITYDILGRPRFIYSLYGKENPHLEEEYRFDSTGTCYEFLPSNTLPAKIIEYYQTGGLKRISLLGNDTVIFDYDSLNGLARECYKRRGRIVWIHTYEWNLDHTEMQEVHTRPAGKFVIDITYHRYKDGKEVESISTKFDFNSPKITYDTLYWKYDAQGRLIERPRSSGPRRTISYNSIGLPSKIESRARRYPDRILSSSRYEYTFKK